MKPSSDSAPATGGTPETTSLHIRLLEDRWIVENGDGQSLAEAASREGAIERAKEVASGNASSTIAVHSRKGDVEMTIDVLPHQRHDAA